MQRDVLIDLHKLSNDISQLSFTFFKMFFSHPELLITQSSQPLITQVRIHQLILWVTCVDIQSWDNHR